ncbi:MAG: ABC transporter permease [Oceanicaulis sp.]
MSALNRIYALIERQWVLIGGSWPRLVDLFYWPVVQITIWGFIQLHVFAEVREPGMVVLAAVLGAVLLWDVTWRSQLGLSLAYMEEIWSRNLGNLLVSPLSPRELILSLMAVSVMKTAIAMVPAVLIAAFFFGFNIFSVGLALPLFVMNLVAFGWSISLVAAGLVTRYGQGAQDMPWALMFGITPFCAVYYPIEVLPDLLEPVARILPPAHIFEGLRGLINEGALDLAHLAAASGLNLLWLGGGVLLYSRLLKSARERGALTQIGE